MILFLAVVSIVNMALGFGLALYLLRSGEMPKRLLPRTLVVARGVSVAAPSQPIAASEQPIESADVAAVEPVSAAPLVASAAADELPQESDATTTADAAEGEPAETTAVEEDVLAGIEAFRAQLAQMKDDPAAAESAAAAVAS